MDAVFRKFLPKTLKCDHETTLVIWDIISSTATMTTAKITCTDCTATITKTIRH